MTLTKATSILIAALFFSFTSFGQLGRMTPEELKKLKNSTTLIYLGEKHKSLRETLEPLFDSLWTFNKFEFVESEGIFNARDGEGYSYLTHIRHETEYGGAKDSKRVSYYFGLYLEHPKAFQYVRKTLTLSNGNGMTYTISRNIDPAYNGTGKEVPYIEIDPIGEIGTNDASSTFSSKTDFDLRARDMFLAFQEYLRFVEEEGESKLGKTINIFRKKSKYIEGKTLIIQDTELNPSFKDSIAAFQAYCPIPLKVLNEQEFKEIIDSRDSSYVFFFTSQSLGGGCGTYLIEVGTGKISGYDFDALFGIKEGYNPRYIRRFFST